MSCGDAEVVQQDVAFDHVTSLSSERQVAMLIKLEFQDLSTSSLGGHSLRVTRDSGRGTGYLAELSQPSSAIVRADRTTSRIFDELHGEPNRSVSIASFSARAISGEGTRLVRSTRI
jgi:hypothetical protein